MKCLSLVFALTEYLKEEQKVGLPSLIIVITVSKSLKFVKQIVCHQH